MELDENPDMYLEYMVEPWFAGGKLNHFVDPQNVLRQFDYIFAHLGRTVPIARTKMRFYTAGKNAGIWSQRKVAAAQDRFGKMLQRRTKP
jgi:hypothetical protein